MARAAREPGCDVFVDEKAASCAGGAPLCMGKRLQGCDQTDEDRADDQCGRTEPKGSRELPDSHRLGRTRRDFQKFTMAPDAFMSHEAFPWDILGDNDTGCSISMVQPAAEAVGFVAE
jgi:hypothetical protein